MLIFILRIICIITALFIATCYTYLKKGEKHYEFFNELIFGGFIVATMWFFIDIWYSDTWQEIIYNSLLFTLFASELFNKIEHDNKT